MEYFFGFRVIRPVGQPVVCGPFETMEAAKQARNNAKAYDAQVTTPFIATSENEAMQRLVKLF